MTEKVYRSHHGLKLKLRDHRLSLILRWPRGCGCHSLPTGFSSFFSGMGIAFSANYIFSCRLILRASVHEIIFQIGPTILTLKLDKGTVLGVATTPHPTEKKLTYFSNHEDDIQS